MKINSLAIAAFLLLSLTGFLYWSNHHRPSEESTKTSADTPPVILKLDENSIQTVQLKKKSEEPVVLSKSNAGSWQITGPKAFRADQTAAAGLASALASVNSERLVEDKASDLKTFGLAEPSLEVAVTGKDNKSQKLELGDDTPAGGAVYAMLAGDPRVFTVASYTKTSLDKGLNDLRDRRFLPVDGDKVSRVELIKKGSDLEFGRNKDDWQILKPSPLRADGTQVGDLVRELTDAKMDLASSGGNDKGLAAKFSQATAVATAKVTDESGTQQLEVRKNKDDYYAKSTALEGVYKVDSTLGKALDKGLDDFRNKKLFGFGYSGPNKIELHNGSKAYSLARGTGGYDDWWSNGKKMDGANVDAVLSSLRDMTATSFPSSGFTNPTMDLIVTSDDGKRSENVQIARAGDHYIAKRENEPALYQLDAAAVDGLFKSADELKPAAATETAQKK